MKVQGSHVLGSTACSIQAHQICSPEGAPSRKLRNMDLTQEASLAVVKEAEDTPTPSHSQLCSAQPLVPQLLQGFLLAKHGEHKQRNEKNFKVCMMSTGGKKRGPKRGQNEVRNMAHSYTYGT